MKILFFCPMWGLGDLPLAEMLEKIKSAGYDGIEFGFEEGDPRRALFISMTRQLGLLTIGQQCYANGADFETYRTSYESNLTWLLSFDPLLINSHTGKDHYSEGQNSELITLAAKMEGSSGVKIVHETHRGRFPFCLPDCLLYVTRFPDLRLTADFSHFCTVSESYLEDQAEALNRITERCDHIHARVGHPQGPQVTDPRLPEYSFALDKHLDWWDKIVEIRRKEGCALLSVTPEFGPAPYMPTAPGTGQPLADQWENNLFMMDLLKSRYL